MPDTNQIQLSLPESVSIKWLEEQNGAWLELEIVGQYLDWLIFRPLSESPDRCVQQLHNIKDAPAAFLQIYGIVIEVDDIKRAYQSYKKSGRAEGVARLRVKE